MQRFWSAVAERSGDTAFARPRIPKAAWRFASRRSPKVAAPPPQGYRWNRVGNDVYMVSIRDGLIAQAVYSLFR